MTKVQSKLRQAANSLLNPLGYEVRRHQPDRDETQGFTLYRYLRDDGTFDYEAYRRIQAEGNREKLDMVWAREENIAFLSEYITRLETNPQFGICHGTRRGKEQEWFRKYLPGCEVIGTEISDAAEQFPNTIRWDFHDVKPEWIGAADFVYSNSLDHSYDPEKCLNAWMSCVRKQGLCILEHSDLHGPRWATRVDPFGADIVQMPYLILTWGKGRYGVRELVRAPSWPAGAADSCFIVVQRF